MHVRGPQGRLMEISFLAMRVCWFKEAGDWYEVYQEEMRTWNFRTFERAFKRQFIGELHEDEIMEDL